MLDFAEFVAINKFDRKGAADALRDVAKQVQRNKEAWHTPTEQMPVFGTMAARFNDDGVTALYQALKVRLRRMNPRAPIRTVHFGEAPIAEILDIRGFNLNAILEIDPDFLESDDHEHDDSVQSFVFRASKPFDPAKLEDFLSGLIQVYGPDMLRYKGVLFMKGSDRQTVFQGVHMMMGADLGRRWQPGEKPSSKMVFIGKKLPKDLFVKGLEQCLA
jgi:G3E family GTPase